MLGATELELYGVAFRNDELAAMLVRVGFTPKTFEVPAALGGGTEEGLSRVFSLAP